jgi:hypothetical protein
MLIVPFFDLSIQVTRELQEPISELFRLSRMGTNLDGTSNSIDLERELLTLLEGLERIAMYCLDTSGAQMAAVEQKLKDGRSQAGQSSYKGWTEYVTNVFSSENSFIGEINTQEKKVCEVSHNLKLG